MVSEAIGEAPEVARRQEEMAASIKGSFAQTVRRSLVYRRKWNDGQRLGPSAVPFRCCRRV